jgi:hypothetical protein
MSRRATSNEQRAKGSFCFLEPTGGKSHVAKKYPKFKEYTLFVVSQYVARIFFSSSSQQPKGGMKASHVAKNRLCKSQRDITTGSLPTLWLYGWNGFSFLRPSPLRQFLSFFYLIKIRLRHTVATSFVPVNVCVVLK